MPGLDRTRRDPPYVCGRLFALLCRIQAKAIGGDGDEERLSASIVSRYYGAASSRPATGLYFPMRMRIAHLNKLDRDARGFAIDFRRELSEVFNLLGCDEHPDLPHTLSPAEQCLFAIGFEHQMAETWKPRRKKHGGTDSEGVAPAPDPDSNVK